MSLKDRLKNNEPEEIKKQSIVPGQEQNVEMEKNTLTAKEKLSSFLRKKISLTPGWAEFSVKRQQVIAIDFIKEQLKLNFPSIKLDNESIFELVESVISSSREFGILENLLKDDEVNYILVNGADSIYAEKNKKLTLTDIKFKNSRELRKFIENLSSDLGYTINEKTPVLDACHKRGYHVNIMIPPAVLREPCITIKKINKNLSNFESLCRQRTISIEMAKMLEIAVLSHANIIIGGLYESGKTTILNSLCNKISPTERVILIEDTEEINLKEKNIICLKTQPLNDNKDTYQVSSLNLLKNSMRMRPDRIILGECKGDESYEFLNAMKTGYFGLMTTIYANSVSDTVERFEKMVLKSANLPLNVIRKDILSSTDLIIYVRNMPNGEKRVVQVSEPIELDDGKISTRDIFVWRKQGEYENSTYEHMSVGNVPKFVEKAKERGFEINNIIFDPKYTHSYLER